MQQRKNKWKSNQAATKGTKMTEIIRIIKTDHMTWTALVYIIKKHCLFILAQK